MVEKLAFRKGVCAIVFRKRAGKTEFLLLHRILHWNGWEFPKGGSNPEETQLQTLRRELREELGVKELVSVKKIPLVLAFTDKVRNRNVRMQVFLVEFSKKFRVLIPKKGEIEHSSFRWFSASKAIKFLTYENQKKIFKKALKHLKN